MPKALIGLFGVVLTGCGHLVGGALPPDGKADGLRYYLPRTQFVVEHQVTGDVVEGRVAMMRVPDFRYPQQIYLRQGWFSADIFDVKLNGDGLLLTVSGDAADKSIESVKSVASFAVGLASSLGKAALVAHAEPPVLASAVPLIYAAAGERPGEGACRLIPGDLDAVVAFLRQFIKRVEAAQQAVRDKPEAVPERVRARLVLDEVEDCLGTIKKQRPELQSKILQAIDADAPEPAHKVITGHVGVDRAAAELSAAATGLEIDLFDRYLKLKPAQAIEEAEQLGAKVKPPRRDRLKETADALKDELRPAGLEKAVETVAMADRRCAGVVSSDDTATLETAVRRLEGMVSCLVRKQTTEVVKGNASFMENIEGALSHIQALLELLLDPEGGTTGALAKASRPMPNVTIDEEFKDETYLHRTLRLRDRFHEFQWRRADLVATKKYAESVANAVTAAEGGLADIRSLLEQRAALRQFLRAPVTAANAKARLLAQDELIRVSAALETRRLPKASTRERVSRLVTPQTYWLEPNSDLPVQGERRGNPGDVFIILRPVAGKGTTR